MPKPLPLTPPRFLTTIVASGCFALLCVSSGCRSISRDPVSRHPSASNNSYHSLRAYQQPYESSAAENVSAVDEPLNSGSTLPLTEDEVAAMYRQLGGKLRPNESGAIVELDLSFCDITHSQLAEILVFPEVTELDLTGTDVEDSGLTPLRNLSNLRSVKLKGTKITSNGLRILSQIPALILIDASNTAVTDEGLVDAGQWINLQYLSLNNTAVSDNGLQHLSSLQNLRGLSVINTAVTETGVFDLKQSLPNCLIVAQTERQTLGGRFHDTLPYLPTLPSSDSTVDQSTPEPQLQQIVALARSQPQLAVHLSKVYTTNQQWSEAVQILESAELAAPDDPEIHAALGEALARSGRPEEALNHFERCVDRADAKYRVGIIMYERTLKKCERYFDDVLRTDPSLNAAVVRRERIQQELASLTHHQGERIDPVNQDRSPEIIPAPSIRNASSSRQISSP